MNRTALSRRTLLRGAGVAIALPWLEAMLPSRASAAPMGSKRFVALYFSDGVLHAGAPNSPGNYWECRPGTNGGDWTLSRTLAPLQAFKSHLNYFNRLDPKDLRALNDGHWTPAPSFLTGQRHTTNAEGGQFWLKAPGRSLDQAVAEKLGCVPLNMAPFPINAIGPSSLPERGVGGFLTNLSWVSQKTVAPRHDSSAKVFSALFGSGAPPPVMPTVDPVKQGKRSILDLVAGEAASLQPKLGVADRQKLDEYLTSIRTVERNIAAEPVVPPAATCVVPPASQFANEVVNNRVHWDYGSKNMIDLMVLAFRCDKTSVATLMLDYENNLASMGSVMAGYNGPAAGADCHIVSHHTTQEHLEAQAVMNDWHVKKFLYLLQQFNGVTEANGLTLLQNSLVMFGSGMGDGNYHGGQSPGDGGGCARVTAGGLGGAIATNRFIDANNVHHANLLAGIAQKFDLVDDAGAPITKWGFGTGALAL